MKTSFSMKGQAMSFPQVSPLCLLIFFEWVWVFLPVSVLAQDASPQNVASLPYEIVCGEGLIGVGDTVWVEIHLGEVASPFTGLLGMDLEVTLTDQAVLPATPVVKYDSSWLADGSGFTSSCAIDPTSWNLLLSCHRSDQQSRTGQGEVLRFLLVAAEDSVMASELVAPHLGGQVIIENLDMKRSLFEEAVSATHLNLRLYPQPATNQLFWKSSQSEPFELCLYDGQGRMRQELGPFDSRAGSISLDHLDAGIWYLQIRYDSGVVESRQFLRIKN